LTWETVTRPERRYCGRTALAWFEGHLDVRGDFECWLWTGMLDKGYGRIVVGGVTHAAYRFSYVLHRAEIPAGLALDHLCRMPACVNPWHLEPVTPAVNSRRALGYRRRKLSRSRRLA
jgi:hypothetical protein